MFEVGLAIGFGAFGFLLIKLRLEAAPLLLGFVLGPALEENLRRALLVSRGDWSVFLTRPLSAVFLLMTVALIAAIAIPAVARRRARTFSQGEAS